MEVNSVDAGQNFQGNVILKSAIRAQQRYSFNQHKPALDQMIKNMPFDLLVEQSKSGKTISMTTNVKGGYSYVMRKGENLYEGIARLAISDGAKKSEAYKKLLKAEEILNYIKLGMYNVVVGNFKAAREAHKKVAELGIKDFEIYTSMINFKITDLPKESIKLLLINSIKYKIYNLFSRKTPEEKQLASMYRAYLKEMKAQNKKIEPTLISFQPINNN